jgi:hypothetical protein
VHPLLLISVLAIDPRAHRVDVSGGATAEVRGGAAPRTPLDNPEPTFLTILTPNVDFQVRHRRGGTFNLGLTPRMQFRVPNRLSVNRPIFLGQVYATHSMDLNRKWTMDTDLGASAGELDYTGVVFALGGGQASTYNVDVAQLAFGSAQIGVEGRVAPTHTVLINPLFQVRTPIGDTADAADQGLTQLPTQLTGIFGLGHRYQASPVDAVETMLRPGVVDYNNAVTFFSTDGRVAWERQLRPQLRSHFDLGVFGARTLRSSGSATAQAEPDVKVFPVGAFRLTGRLYASSTHRVEGNIGAGAQGFFDRISERVEPRGNVTMGITTFVPPRWTIGVSATGFTALTPSPRPIPPMATFRVPETVITGTTPVTYRIDDNTQFEFGTVVSVRASHFADPSFEFSQFAGWLYIAFRIAGGTARGGEEVGQRQEGEPIGVGAQGFNAAAGGQQW